MGDFVGHTGAAVPKRITSHAIGTVFYRVHDDGMVEIAAMNYTRKNRTTLRVPMGKGLTKDGENLTETQVREVVQEAAEDPNNFEYKLGFGGRLVYWEVVPDDLNPATELHLKAFFAAELTKGELRTYRMVEHEGTPEEETLDRLVWYSVGYLSGKMSERGRTPWCHAKAVLSTVVKLVEASPKVAAKYGTLADGAASQIALSTQHQPLVVEYVKFVQGG